MRTMERGQREAEDAVLRLVQEHAAELLRFARRFSYCADDAHDAYQRTLEILVKRMRVEPPAQPLSWVRTVLRHESLAVRAQRDQCVNRVEVDFDHHESLEVDDPADRAVGHEQIRQTAEALRRLKPPEVTALLLRAEGLTYKEICARTGWTYTKCNRAITEGRRALIERLGAIQSGAECDRWLPLLSALADGEASPIELTELRPHLRSCPACRATLRDFHAAPARVAAVVPAALVPAAVAPLAGAPGGSLLGQVEVILHGLAERATLVTMRVQGAFEGLAGAKVAAVAASTAAIAGGGVAIERVTQPERPRGETHVATAPVPPTHPPAGLATLAAGLPDAAMPVSANGSGSGSGGEFASRRTGREPEFGRRASRARDVVAASSTGASAAAAREFARDARTARTASPPPHAANSPSPPAQATPVVREPAPDTSPQAPPSPRQEPEWQAPEFGARR